MPYTRDLAHELIDAMEHSAARPPASGCSWRSTPADGMVGDVAVWLDTDATFAMIGYTLDPDHQGRGYAIEAVEAVIEWLFRRRTRPPHRGHHRSAQPRLAPACSNGADSSTSAPPARQRSCAGSGPTTLGSRCSSRTGRRGATARPGRRSGSNWSRSTADNVRDGRATSSGRSHSATSSAPVLVSLAEALVPPTIRGDRIEPWFRAIVADDTIVGFILMAEPYERQPDPYLWRLVVDLRHQRRGIGRRALEQIIDERRAAGFAAHQGQLRRRRRRFARPAFSSARASCRRARSTTARPMRFSTLSG